MHLGKSQRGKYIHKLISPEETAHQADFSRPLVDADLKPIRVGIRGIPRLATFKKECPCACPPCENPQDELKPLPKQPMKTLIPYLSVLFFTLTCMSANAEKDKSTLEELDTFWKIVSKSVREGDFEDYKETCHENGILVSGSSQKCQPLTQALAGWKQGLDDTKAGLMQASVTFRFSQRLHDTSTAHETGIFLYTTVGAEGNQTTAYIHFEALLIKQGIWKTMMEYQKGPATVQEWAALDTP